MTEVRDASTVILLRDGADGLDVWLMTRATSMVFAGGMAVFPGGRVDERDVDIPCTVEPSQTMCDRFGCSVGQARALLGAAVRELFEETGVLLTAPAIDLSSRRAGVESGAEGFGALLHDSGVRADIAGLQPWSRWITPEGEVRRYDARFFVVALPDGIEPHDVTSESSSAGWFGVGEALEQAQRGELGMMPPTVMTLASLAGYPTVAEAVAAAPERVLDPISPTVSRDDSGEYSAHLPDGTRLPLPRSLFPAD